MKSNIIQFIIGGFGGVMVGYVIARQGINSLPLIVAIFVSVIVFLYVHVVIHESGHLLFGLLTGYELISFRIGKFMWIKENEHYVFKKFGLMGTGGQCLMSPPTNSQAFFFYNAGGVLMNLMVSIVAILFAFQTQGVLSVILFGLAIPGIYLGLANGIPFMFDVANDGYNIKMILKDKNSIDAFYAQLRLANSMSKGISMKDWPLYEMPENADLNNPLFSTMYCANISHHLDNKDYELAKQQSLNILNYKIMSVHRVSLLNDLLMMEALNEGNIDTMKHYATKKVRSNTNLANNPLVAYIIYKVIDKDEKKAVQAIKRFEHIMEHYPYPAEVIGQRNAMERIRAKYCSVQ